jgi:hypothetical protein
MSRGGSQHTMKMDSVRHEESTTYVPFSEEAANFAKAAKFEPVPTYRAEKR